MFLRHRSVSGALPPKKNPGSAPVNLLVNDKITASNQRNISPKAYQTLQTTKMNFEKTVGLTSFQKPPLQSASSL